MNDPQKPSTETPLKAADFSPQAPVVDTEAVTASAARPAWLIPAIAGTAVALLFVLFVLPKLVASDPEANPAANDIDNAEQHSGVSNSPKAKAQPETSERSPFAEAQEGKLRRQAQEILQPLLELQGVLVELGVEQWAAEEYTAAISEAEAGDAAYKAREFEPAIASYQSALDQLRAIEDSIPARIDQAYQATLAAIENGDSGSARTALNALATLDPSNPALPAIEARIDSIPAVQGAIAEARTAAEQDDYQTAVAVLTEAARLDPAHQLVSQLTGEYREALRIQNFRDAMSDGYALLEQGQFDRARAAFARATKISPNASEPGAALAELEIAETAAKLQTLKKDGARFEGDEQWAKAIEAYKAAQAIDATVLFAADGLTRATPRAQLDKRLSDTLDNPNRLSDLNALKEAEQLLEYAKRVPAPGTKLTQQIAQLTETLEYARTPVTVIFTSDSATDVTLRRVKRIGSFEREAMTLRPGEYTAVGIRTGFRDVRVTFTVKPDESSVVDVRCTEAI